MYLYICLLWKNPKSTDSVTDIDGTLEAVLGISFCEWAKN